MDTAPSKITLQTLLEFCSTKPNPKEIRQPYFNRGKIIATDSRILVAVDPLAVEPIEGDMPANGPDLVPKLFPFDHDTLPPETWVDIPAVDVPTIPCKKCSGTGKLRLCTKCEGIGTIYSTCPECGAEREAQCSQCGGEGHTDSMPEIECPDCEGDGHLLDNTRITCTIGCVFVNKLYLSKINRFFSNPKIEKPTSGYFTKMVRFKFDGGLGYLMPMRIGGYE